MIRRMTLALLAGLVGMAAIAAIYAFTPFNHPLTTISAPGDIKRGAYLARLSGCLACHTSENGSPFAGGVEIASPFGTFITPNITRDANHGIGLWSKEAFANAVRHGVAPDGQPYYPSFPYAFYAELTDRDIADLWAALGAVPPVAQSSPSHRLNFPFTIRQGLKFWRPLFEYKHDFVPDTSKSAAWNRGRYLVEGPAHCGACHTPRNLAGARDVSNRLAGNPNLFDGGKAPSLSAGELKDTGWSRAELVQALKTGVTPDGDVLGGSMAEYVRDNSTYFLTQHLEDIAEYLLAPDRE